MQGLGDQQGRDLCESDFEREMFDALVESGFRVIPQVPVGNYRIDLVVEGNDGKRLAVECDGDRYHGPERWMEDMSRQRVLERAGWRFWRCWGSSFARNRVECLAELFDTLAEEGIEPVGSGEADFSGIVEFREIDQSPENEIVLDDASEPVASDPLAEDSPGTSGTTNFPTDNGNGSAVRQKVEAAADTELESQNRNKGLIEKRVQKDLFEGDVSDLELFRKDSDGPAAFRFQVADGAKESQPAGPRVSIGDEVRFRYSDDESEEEHTLRIVDGQSNPNIGHVNYATAVAQGLLETVEGQECEIILPGGVRTARVINVESRQ